MDVFGGFLRINVTAKFIFLRHVYVSDLCRHRGVALGLIREAVRQWPGRAVYERSKRGRRLLIDLTPKPILTRTGT